MDKSKNVIYTNNFVPYRPRLYTYDEKDIHIRFLEERYKRIVSDPDDYFTKVMFTNFDLINHECRGDELEHDRQYYETLFKKDIDSELMNKLHKDLFVSAAQRSERQDVRFEKDLQQDHFKPTNLKKQLKQKGICLSSMQKRTKTTDGCKTLPF